MVRLADFARVSGDFHNSTYLPITIKKLNKGTYSYFTRKIESGIASGVSAFQIRVSDDVACYPNAIVPIAGVIDYYRSRGIEFRNSRSISDHPYLSNVGLQAPYEDPRIGRQTYFTDRVWKFDPDTHYEIVSGIMSDIQGGLEVERGILQSIELCLNEITDNVLNHSLSNNTAARKPSGFVMAQIHDDSKRIAITVFDTGQGILNSLKNAKPEMASSSEAISIALKKGVTSGHGRGYGMWILDRIVLENRGSLEIVSGDTRFTRINGRGTKSSKPSYSMVHQVLNGTTLVDFQLNAGRLINISDVLEYDPVNLWLESHENDGDQYSATVKVVNESKGFGSRIAARETRTIALNLSKEFEGSIVLDFDGVDLISTSYADELVVKLLETPAIRNRLRLVNLNEACRAVIAEVSKA